MPRPKEEESERSKAYRVYKSETLCVEESMHVKFDDKEPEVKLQSKMKALKINRLLKILQNLIKLKNLKTVQKLNQLQKLKMK